MYIRTSLFRIISFILCMSLSHNVFAIALNSTFVVADEDGSGLVEIANNDGKAMFIRLELSKVTYSEDGKKIITPLNKDNMNDWDLNVSPPQLIMKDGEFKSIKFSYFCNDAEKECSRDKDQVYLIKILPEPYSESNKSVVALAFGYNIYYMIPAKDVKLDYSIKRVGKNKFEFVNNSNTFLNAVINVCTKEFREDCIYEHRLLAHTKHEFVIPQVLERSEKIDAVIINANQTIKEFISF
ncbi:pilus assembly protein [Vibrio parahaemolyticus]|nr:pilus assembly protein [Vibrio parahaemolyticus]